MKKLLKTLALSAFVAGAALAPLAANAATAKPSKPNVLLLLTDDIGLDQLRIYGYGNQAPFEAPPTPNLAALQTAGLTFRNAWTMPACSTARGVLYTGRYPFRTELYAALGPSDLANSMISPYERTIPKLMSEAGYATGLFGKFHIGLQGNNPFEYGMPHAVGWDYFSGWLDETGDPSSIDTTAGGVAPAGTYPNGYVPNSSVTGGADTGACYEYPNTCNTISTPAGSKNPAGRQCRDKGGIFDPNQSCVVSPIPDYIDFETLSSHYVSPLVINDGANVQKVQPTEKDARTFRNVQQTDAAIAWINSQTKPWFATVSTATVHTPMQVPPPDTLPGGGGDTNDVTTQTTAGKIQIANEMISAMDSEFGRLLLATDLAEMDGGNLKITAAAKNTVIIYVNDNGSLGSQVRVPFNPYRSKGTPYQTGVWTPMVVAGAVVKTPGQNVNAMVNIADLYQFIGELGGIDVRKNNPRRVDSVAMMPYFKNPNRASIRKYDFTLVGPNLQADGGSNGPCQFPGASGDSPSCSQIPVTKGVCEDNGGTWFGVGATGTYPTPYNPSQTETPIPTDGSLTNCCEVQQWIKNNGGVPGTVVPVTGISVRDNKGWKLVRNQMTDYDVSTNECFAATYDELYTIRNYDPLLLDNKPRLIQMPYTQLQAKKYRELVTYMNRMLNSEPNCLQYGDGNDDGVVNTQDLLNYDAMYQLVQTHSSTSSWYDVNLDGVTNSTDRGIIAQNLGKRCRK